MSGRRRCVVTEVVVILTDGNVVLDVRGITAEELGWLNEVAQEVTEGELWWEVIGKNCRRSSHAETQNAPGQRIRPLPRRCWMKGEPK
jgi:hypothetical protein